MSARFAPARFSLVLAALSFAGDARAQDKPPPPVLRLEAGGPTSMTTAMAFSPDGQTLYAAGFDKVVRVWTRGPNNGPLKLDEKRYFRVPVNPGTQGAINAMALSPDGAWLAVGGLGVVREKASFFVNAGRLWPTVGLTPDQWSDLGVVYVFSTDMRQVKQLRGHKGAIRSLAFASQRAGKPPMLVSLAQLWNGQSEASEVLVWDVAAGGKPLAEAQDLPAAPPGGLAPSVVAMHTGAKPKQLRVAIALGDEQKGDDGKKYGFLRIWDVDGDYLKEWDGARNAALAQSPDGNRLLSGSYLDGQGRLQHWDLTTSPPTPKQRVPLPAAAQNAYLPAALGFLGRDADDVAVLVHHLQAGQADRYRLHLVNVGSGQTKAAFPLWTRDAANPSAPVLAVSPTGDHVAVGGWPDQKITVFAVADLLAKKAAPEILQSAGAVIRFAAFAKDGKGRPGLFLSEDAAGQGDLPPQKGFVLDMDKRQLTATPAGWNVARSMSDWTISQQGPLVRVFQGNQPVTQIQLPSTPQSIAFTGPLAPLQVPMLAAAFFDVAKGLPTLAVYHAGTGKHFRRFTAHTGPVTSLAFSPDNRFLVSAAHDQTVAVWSLTDIGEILGQHGRLPGVAVEARPQGLTVAVADKGAALSEGAIIEGVVAGQEVKPLTKARAFYETFWLMKPGEKVTLRVLEGKVRRDLALTADQGIEERKPLFFLFVTKADAAGHRDWLGWHAQGPFDASSKSAERHLGWHINTGQAEEPTKFAFIDQYRKEFHKEGLLAKLLAKGTLDLAPPPPPPPPEFGRLSSDKDPQGVHLIEKQADGGLLVRQRKAVLFMEVKNLALQSAGKLEWQLDGGAPQAADATSDLAAVPLDLPAEAGIHKVRLTLHWQGADEKPRQAQHDLTLRYQPPAPVLQFSKNTLHEETNEAAYLFKAFLSAPGDGPGMRAELFLNNREKPEKRWDLPRAAKPSELAHEVALEQGDNLFKLVAQNQPSLAGFESLETHTLTVKVRYKPKGPAIAIHTIESLDGDASPLPARPGQQTIVSVPRVRIKGVVKSPGKLAALEWHSEVKDPAWKSPRVAVKDLTAEANKEAPFTVETVLKPGPQLVRFFAKDAQGQDGYDDVALLYRPALPRLVLQAPEPTLRHTGPEAAKTPLVGRLLPPDVPSPEPYPLEATLFVSGVKQQTLRLQSTDDALPAATAALKPGPNRVQVSLSHPWGGQPEQADFSVAVVRPPVIAKVTHEFPDTKLPFVNLTAQVASPLPLLLGKVVVRANGQERSFAKAETLKDGAGWLLKIQEVALVLHKGQETHDNNFTVAVANDEAAAEPSAPLAVRFTEPLPPAPLILVDVPSPGLILSEPQLALVFRIRSVKELKRVQVTLESEPARPMLFQADDLAKRKPVDTDLYEFTTPRLSLHWGLNTLKVTAVNAGGESHLTRDIGVPIWPVKVAITSLTANQKKYALAEGAAEFPSIPGERAILEGKVRWSSRDDELFKMPHQVRVYVNGFQQAPGILAAPPLAKTAALATAGGNGGAGDEPVRERAFRVPVTLNLPHNVIDLSLPSLKLGADNRLQCSVACAKPSVKGQYLHVVLVSPGMKSGKDLKKSMIRTLKIEETPGNLFKNGVFDRVYFHLLTGYILPNDIHSQLFEIQCDLRERAGQGAANDVMMFYFLGQDGLSDQGWCLLTSGGAQKPLALQRLKSTLGEFTGAQALFLDLRSGETPYLEKDRFAMFRYYQPGPVQPPRLLHELEQVMPKATWLEDLPSILEARLQGEQRFLYHHPPGLKIRLNP